MKTCTIILTFCCAHRLYEHEGKCAFLHGHNYKVEITVRGHLDKIGRIVDFTVLKERVKKWIDNNWDHSLLLYDKDPLLDIFHGDYADQVIVCNFNPTAENMVDFLRRKIINDILVDFDEVFLEKIKLWETETSFVEIF